MTDDRHTPEKLGDNKLYCLECERRWPCAHEAGYRAAMEAAKKNYDDLQAEDWSFKSSWEVHGEWLDEQVKKEGA